MQRKASIKALCAAVEVTQETSTDKGSFLLWRNKQQTGTKSQRQLFAEELCCGIKEDANCEGIS